MKGRSRTGRAWSAPAGDDRICVRELPATSLRLIDLCDAVEAAVSCGTLARATADRIYALVRTVLPQTMNPDRIDPAERDEFYYVVNGLIFLIEREPEKIPGLFEEES